MQRIVVVDVSVLILVRNIKVTFRTRGILDAGKLSPRLEH